MLNSLRRMLGEKNIPLAEVEADTNNPVGVRVNSYQWTNPEELQPGIKNPFVLLLHVTLQAAQPVTVQLVGADMGKTTFQAEGFQPISVSAPTDVTLRFTIPYEGAIRPLGPALLVTVAAVTERTKRFRVHAVPT